MRRQNSKFGKTGQGLVLLLLTCAGCASTADHRVKQFNDDGVFLFSRGDYAGARDSFEAALTLTPQDPALVFNMGQCHDRLGDWRKAEQYYLTCLELDVKHGAARHAQTMLLSRTGRAPEAKRMVQEYVQQHPARADALVLDGWRLRQEKALPLAQQRLQQALALEPNHPRGLVELGIVYEMSGMPERALALYERALGRDPMQFEVAERIRQLRAKGIKQPLPD
ncbi:MAG: tetratricopeptide repeat protein [Gemmataceae bacterium]|nr:tetratricopeptide repeat protein [Gemmataceae bacterium]